MKKKVVAFVPVKLNNERLPGKNTKPFRGGEPLITYILHTLKEAKGIDEIYVYCSDESIRSYLPEGVHYLKRSASLDSSSTLILEVLQSFARDVEADFYVLAHATAPFLSTASVETGLEKVLSGEYDSALTMTRVEQFLWKDGVPMYDRTKIPRTQDIGDLYAETTGLYIYPRELILEQSRRTGDRPFVIEVGREEAIDINEPLDFDIAQVIFDRRTKHE